MRLLLVLALLASPVAMAEDAPAKFKRLYAEKATASSFLKSNWNKYNENYHPNYILDDNPKTAWVEGAKGNGDGESISWRVSKLERAKAVRLRVRNGYHKRKDLLRANAAMAVVKVELLGARDEVVHTAEWSLKKKLGWQTRDFPLPKRASFGGVRLTILKSHAGTKYADNCVSDVQVLVDADIPYNPALEEKRRQRLAAWALERKRTAAYFAKLPKTYPFASTEFDYEPPSDKDVPPFDPEDLDRFKRLSARVDYGEADEAEKAFIALVEERCGPFLKTVQASQKWPARVVERKGRAPALPDAFSGMEDEGDEASTDLRTFGFLFTKDLTLFEASGKQASPTRVRWRDKARTEVSAFVRKVAEASEGEGRGTYYSHFKDQSELFEYDEQGRLSRYVMMEVLTDSDFSPETRFNYACIRPRYDAQSRVNEVRHCRGPIEYETCGRYLPYEEEAEGEE